MTQIEPLEARRMLSQAAAHVPLKQVAHRPAAAVQVNHAKARLNPFYWAEISQPEEDAGQIPYAGTAGPAAPPLSGGVTESVGFDSGASAAGYYNIPPDSNNAAGPNHLVDVVNTTLEIYGKSGTLIRRQRLGKNATTAAGSFFASLNPVNGLFDAKVMYDQYAGRFVVVAMEQTDTADGDASNTSRILVAASATSDPTGAWYFAAINAKVTTSGKSRWADYPGLGLDAQGIYVTGNLFGFGTNGTFAGTRLWIIPKSAFYAGSAMTSKVFNPASTSGLGNTTGFTLQPAHLYGTAPGSTGTFLVSSGYVSGTTDQLSVIRVDNPLATTPTFTNQMVNVGDVDNGSGSFPGDVAQPGTANTIDAGDERVLNAVWRGGALWAVNTVNPPTGADAGQATAHWYKISTATPSALSVADQGNVGGEDLGAGTATFYPWVMVDARGDMAVSFAAAGAGVYAGAYYTGRMPTDAAGTVRGTGTLAAGVDSYYRTFGGDRNRWGDYSGLALDPADESTFWAFNEYAQARGTVLSGLPGEDGRWGTRFASFSFAASIGGAVYSDDNFSGVREGAEAGVAGATVFLDANHNGVADAGEAVAVTDVGGNYAFANLLSGAYDVRLVVPGGYVGTTGNPQGVSPAAGVGAVANFGVFPTTFAGNQFALRLDGSGGNLEISRAGVALGTPTYSAPRGALPGLTFTTSGAGEGLSIDLGNGTPLPAPGVTYVGAGAGVVSVVGSAGADVVGVTGSVVSVGGIGVSYAGASAVSVATGGGDDSVELDGAIVAGVNLSLGSGADVLTLDGAALTLGGDVAVTSPTLTVNATDSVLVFNASQHLAALNLFGSSVATVSAGGGKVLVVGTISMGAGARLDLADNDMVVEGGWPGVVGALASGYAGGAWTGLGVMSSAARDDAGHVTGIGYARASELGVGAFAGEGVPAGALVLKYTYVGDANLDGRVDGDDFAIVDRSVAAGSGASWVAGDFNYDSLIDAADELAIAHAYGSQGPRL